MGAKALNNISRFNDHPTLKHNSATQRLFKLFNMYWPSTQFSSVVWSCPTLQLHGLQHTRPPCPHQLPEFTQIHVHWVGDSIQPSHPLSPPSPPALSLPQHQGLFQWVSSSHQVAKILELQLINSPFKGYSGLISLRIDWFDPLAVQGTLKSLLQHPVQKKQFCTQLYLRSSSHIYTWLLEKPQLWLYRSLSVKWCLCYLMWILLSSLSLFLPCLSNGHNNPPTKFVHCEN